MTRRDRGRSPGVTLAMALATLTAVALSSLTAVAPARAATLYEPTPGPTAAPTQAGGRAEVPWAGVAITFPETWEVRFKRPPGAALQGGAAILVALGPDSAICTLDLFDPATVEQWEDVGIEPVAELTVAGVPALRYDDMWGGGAFGVSSYAVFTPGIQYSLLCKADVAPEDRWLSIAETIELRPAEAVTFQRLDP